MELGQAASDFFTLLLEFIQVAGFAFFGGVLLAGLFCLVGGRGK